MRFSNLIHSGFDLSKNFALQILHVPGENHLRKNDLHIRVPAAIPGPGWGKIRGKNRY